MKKTILILSGAALFCGLGAACGNDESNSDHNDGGAPGTGDGDATGDGDSASNGGGGSNGTGTAEDACSDEVTYIDDYGEAGGAGGVGGAPAASCALPQAPKGKIAITGTYEDQWGSYEISDESWTAGDSVFHFSMVDNEEGFAVALNDPGNLWAPCGWSRFVWFEEDGSLYYCQKPYAGESECAALEEELPDRKNLSSGCNGFPWSEVTKK